MSGLHFSERVGQHQRSASHQCAGGEFANERSQMARRRGSVGRDPVRCESRNHERRNKVDTVDGFEDRLATPIARLDPSTRNESRQKKSEKGRDGEAEPRLEALDFPESRMRRAARDP
jgi:hypothetical protein